MATDSFVILMVIQSILMVELVYFLLCNSYYVYNNPRYRAFWAVFGHEPPSNMKNMQTHRNATKHTESKSLQQPDRTSLDINTSTPLKSSNTDSNTNEAIAQSAQANIDMEFNNFETKKKAFLNYGLDTVIYCVIFPVSLIGLLCYMGVQLKITVIAHNNAWLDPKNTIFCTYAYKFALGAVLMHWFMQIIFCVIPLKVILLNPVSAHKCNISRIIPSIAVIVIFLSFIIEVFRVSTIEYKVLDFGSGTSATCLRSHGIGNSVWFMPIIMFLYYLCLLLTMLSVSIPLCVQKRMLKNLPNKESHNNVVALIVKINAILKRVCIVALSVIAAVLLINVMFWIVPFTSPLFPFLVLANVVLVANYYVMMLFIWKDWEQRLCPLCYTKEIPVDDAKEEKEVELTSIMDVPQWNKDPSTFDGHKPQYE